MYHRPIEFALDELMISPSAIADGKYLLFTGWVIDKSTWKELLDNDPGLQPLGPLLHELPDPPAPTEEEIATQREAWARAMAEMQRMEMDAQESEEEEEDEDDMRSEPESEDASSERA